MSTAAAGPATTAAEIVTAAHARRDDRVDAARDPQDWSNTEIRDRFIAVLRSVAVWAVNDRTIAANVPDSDDGRTFGYSVAEILDAVTITDVMHETAEIHTDSPTQYRMTW